MSNSNRNLGAAFPQSAQQRQPPPDSPPQEQGTSSKPAERGSQAMRRYESSKIAMKETGEALLHSGETLGSLFLASALEGYAGKEKLQFAGVDARIPTGLAMQGYGLFRIFNGEKGGEHLLAVGNGVTGSWLASQGRDAGKALRERNNPPAQGQVGAGTQSGFRGEGPMIQVPELDVIHDAPSLSLPAWQGSVPQPDPYYNPFAGAPPLPQAPYPPPTPYPYPPPPYPYPPPQGWMAPTGLLLPPGTFDPRALQPQQAAGASSPSMPAPEPQMAGQPRHVMETSETEGAEGARPVALPRLHVSPQAPLDESFAGRRSRGLAVTPGRARRDHRRDHVQAAARPAAAPLPRPIAPQAPRRPTPVTQPYNPPPPPVSEPVDQADQTLDPADGFPEDSDLALEDSAFEGGDGRDPSETFPSEENVFDD